MKKLTFLMLSWLLCMAATSARAGADTAYGTRLTRESLNKLTVETKIAIECTQITTFGHFYNGSGRTTGFDDSKVFVLEPILNNGAATGTFYIKKSTSSDYLQTTNGSSWGAKSSAAVFSATKVDVADVGNDYYYNATTVAEHPEDFDYALRLQVQNIDSKGFLNMSNFGGYPTGMGCWSVQNVYKVRKVVINEVKDGVTTPKTRYCLFAGENIIEINTYPYYNYEITGGENLNIADGKFSVTNEGEDITLTVTYTATLPVITYKYMCNGVFVYSENIAIAAGEAYPTPNIPDGYLQITETPAGEVSESETIEILVEPGYVINSENSTLNQKWTNAPTPWGAEDITDYPATLTVKEGTVRSAETTIKADVGILTIFFKYSGGAHRLNILGVDIVDANGAVVASDYHVGFTGGAASQNTYTVAVPVSGKYTMRYFVNNIPGGGEMTQTNGDITVTFAGYDNTLASLIAEAETLSASAEALKGTEPGYYTETSVNALKAAIETAKAVTTATQADIDALQAAIDGLVIAMPVAEKYYIIRSGDPRFYEKQNVYKAMYSTGSAPAWADEDDTNLAYFWKVVAVDGGYTIQNMADESYINGLKMGASSVATLKSLGEAQFHIVSNGKTLHAYNHGGGSGESNNIVDYSNELVNTPSAWKFVDVTDKYDAAVEKAAIDAAREELYTAIKNASENFTYDNIPVALTTTEGEAGYISCPQEHNTINPGSKDGDGVPALIDDDPNTFMHSAWKNVPAGPHYIQVDMGEGKSLSSFILEYVTRSGASYDFPTEITIKGSDDGSAYTQITKLSGLATGGGKTNTSDVINSSPYRYLRFEVTATTNNRTYFHMAEFSLIEVKLQDTKANEVWAAAIAEAEAADTDNATAESLKAAAKKLAETTAKIEGADILDKYASMHAAVPALGQYTTASYNALKDVVEKATSTASDIEAAIEAFLATKNMPVFTIDGVIDYAAGKSIYDNGGTTLYFKTTNMLDRSMLWVIDQNVNTVGVSESLAISNYGTGKNFWGSDNIKVTETSDANENDGIFLFYTVGGGDPIHAQDVDQQVVRWGSTESTSGSAWKFNYVLDTYTLDQVSDEMFAAWSQLIDAYQNLKITKAARTIGDGVGEYTADVETVNSIMATAEQLLAAGYSAVLTTPIQEIEAAKVIVENAIASYSINTPVAGYYRFGSMYYKGTYMLSDVYSENAKRLAMGEGNGASSIFYLDADNKLVSYDNGRYLPKAVSGGDWTCLPVGSEAEAATFREGITAGTYGFYIGNDIERSYFSATPGHVDAGGQGNIGYDWYIEEVTSLPVAVTAAGYATFYAPVDVTIPTGVQAYYIKNVSGAFAVLTELVDAIPANTGVILVAEEGTYNFEITSGVEAVTDNMLQGTVASEILNNGNTFILGIVNSEVGMYRPVNGDDAASFINKGHKAYLHVSGAANSAGYSFRFGDDGTTGIDNVEGAVEENVIYDLTGRRVENAVKGVYIVNGKKVLVK